MDKELELLLPDIRKAIEELDPRLFATLSQSSLDMLIKIAYTVAKNDNIPKENLVYAISLLTLDMLSQEVSTNISSKKIKDVSVTMGSWYGVSKWKVWYDALLNGDLDGIYALRYVGIG